MKELNPIDILIPLASVDAAAADVSRVVLFTWRQEIYLEDS
jgi:hypothetical protein